MSKQTDWGIWHTLQEEINSVIKSLSKKNPQLKVICTCIACPEQYEVFQVHADGSETELAYMRLRWGRFYVTCPFRGTIVYEPHNVHGNGCFDEDEREYHLNIAIQKIREFYNLGE